MNPIVLAFPTESHKHYEGIAESLEQLVERSRRTAEPAPIQHQFIGTVIDNTIVFLSGAARVLNQEFPPLHLSEFKMWISAMQAIHRSFLTSIIIATEAGLVAYCETSGSCATSNRYKKLESLIEKHKDSLPEKFVRDVFKLVSKKPNFADYLNTALSHSKISEERTRMWRRYFRALNTIRNKASHFDVDLSDEEISTLKEAGFEQALIKERRFTLNPLYYSQICDHICMFFDELLATEASVIEKTDIAIKQV